jgi:hypothetical protein
MQRGVIFAALTLCMSAPFARADHARPLLNPKQLREASVVTTHRSDGGVFPAVSQRPRQQRVRQVKIVGSRQALPARGSWETSDEPPDGGDFVAPAGTISSSDQSITNYVIAKPNGHSPRRQARPQRPAN